jgi:hypothetical protein
MTEKNVDVDREVLGKVDIELVCAALNTAALANRERADACEAVAGPHAAAARLRREADRFDDARSVMERLGAGELLGSTG